MIQDKIYYRKVRDLGSIFSATFGFIKQNFKPLYASLLFFAGPFLLVAAVISANMFGTGLSFTRLFKSNIGAFYSEFMLPYFITLVVILIGITVFDVIVNKNLIENEKMQQNQRLTVSDSTTNFFSDYWRVLGNTFLMILVFILLIVVFTLIFGGLIALAGSNRGDNGGLVGSIVVIVLLVIGVMIIFGPILTFVPIAAIFVCQRDRINIFAAIRKVFYYLKGNYWSTWAVIFVGGLAYGLMAFVVQIPVFIVSFISTFSRIKMNNGSFTQDDSTPLFLVIIISICSLLSYGIRVVFYLISVYQYTSLEEKKEGAAIIDKINQIN